MVSIKSHSLALEIDLSLKLELNNGQYNTLATFLDGYQEPQNIATQLMGNGQQYVLDVISYLRKK